MMRESGTEGSNKEPAVCKRARTHTHTYIYIYICTVSKVDVQEHKGGGR